MSEGINEIACHHCNDVMCSVCENRTCDNTKLATLKCREWRDRRAGFYCGYMQAFSYAKTIIQDLLDNPDEYTRKKAEAFLKEVSE